MTPLLLSALFPETELPELAELVQELGYAGLDLAVHGQPCRADRQLLAELAETGTAVPLLSCDTTSASSLRAWAELAAEYGCGHLRCGLWPAVVDQATRQLEALAAVGAATGVTILIPNHAASCFREPAMLAHLLADFPPRLLAALLAPDQLPRWREVESERLANGPLPAVGAVQVANYRWQSELVAGNQRRWSARLASANGGLTPWQDWLHRLRQDRFDGLVTFGDATLLGSHADRLRVARDDLRYVRRIWQPGPARGVRRPAEDETYR